VLQHDHAGVAEELDALEQRPSQPRVLAISCHRPGRGAGLEQHGVAHADLADVVQERNPSRWCAARWRRGCELLGHPAGEAGDAPRVPLRLGVAVVEHRHHPVEQVGGALVHQLLEALVQAGELRVLRLHDGGQWRFFSRSA